MTDLNESTENSGMLSQRETLACQKLFKYLANWDLVLFMCVRVTEDVC